MNKPTPDAVSILVDAADTLTARGKQRDQPSGERSMGRTVRAFNAVYGTSLTETQGWQFMTLLKLVRASSGSYHPDDYIDQAGYAALAGECAAQAQATAHATAVRAARFDEAEPDILNLQSLLQTRHGTNPSS